MTFMAIQKSEQRAPNIRLVSSQSVKPYVATLHHKQSNREVVSLSPVSVGFLIGLLTLLGAYYFIQDHGRRLNTVTAETIRLRQQFESLLTAIEGLSEISRSQASIIDKRVGSSSNYKTIPSSQPPQPLKVVTVHVPKANLRAGPGKNHGVLMAISEGVRLVVEQSVADWHSVIAPSGERAWISSKIVTEEPLEW